MNAEIVFPIELSQRFTYRVPEHLQAFVQVGVRALVPFGRRETTGYVVGLTEKAPEGVQLRDIIDILDAERLFTEEIFRLSEWIADYYLAGLGEVLRATLPAALSLDKRKYAVAVDDPGHEQQETGLSEVQRRILSLLRDRGKQTAKMVQRRLNIRGVNYHLARLHEAGLISFEELMTGRKTYEVREKVIRLVEEKVDQSVRSRLERRAPKQLALIEVLAQAGGSMGMTEALRRARASHSSLKGLLAAGILQITERVKERDYYGDLHVPPAPKLILNDSQSTAVQAICSAVAAGEGATFLLHGVTGSGKTQVYIEAMRGTVEQGGSAIVLVPEIALTPQTVRRFRSEFQDNVVVLHSRMSNGERYDTWRKIRSGRARVVVGPRSAIFAPVKNLGVIIVDEEHENSYKQTDTAPRYHARDVAVVRGMLEKAVVVLGSATPSLESYYNVQIGKYRYLELKTRVADIPMPAVKIVNLSRESRGKNVSTVLSRYLIEKLQDRLEKKEQTILLQNRRGYSSAVRCEECGYVQMCPDCNISMSYHLRGRSMRCHYCNLTERAPSQCPECASAAIRYQGIGTQRVEETIAELFPQARLARMDLDTTRGKKAHDTILQQFAEFRYDILLGTQMIAKGLDFANVTLVGVISADTGLYLPDFRASERTFQLLTQVAGRAGRKHKRGEVVIQTWSPKHNCLVFASTHDYKGFFEQETRDRSLLRYPPYGKLVLIQFLYHHEGKTLEAALKFAALFRSRNSRCEVLGPAPSPITRIQKNYRFQIVLKVDRTIDPSGAAMRRALRDTIAEYKSRTKYSRVRLRIDIDPVVIL